jgi:hypothetical protein
MSSVIGKELPLTSSCFVELLYTIFINTVIRSAELFDGQSLWDKLDEGYSYKLILSMDVKFGSKAK